MRGSEKALEYHAKSHPGALRNKPPRKPPASDDEVARPCACTASLLSIHMSVCLLSRPEWRCR